MFCVEILYKFPSENLSLQKSSVFMNEFFIDEAVRHEIAGINRRARELNLTRPLVAVLPVRTGSGMYRWRPQLGVFEPELTGDGRDPSKGSGENEVGKFRVYVSDAKLRDLAIKEEKKRSINTIIQHFERVFR